MQILGLNLRLLILYFLFGFSFFYGHQKVLYRFIDASSTHWLFTSGRSIGIIDKKTKATKILINDQMELQNPLFSPDGKMIAYSKTANGNTDVYIIDLEGGRLRRLTHHPGKDMVRSWNGKRVIYSSFKESAPSRYSMLYEIDPENGHEKRLPFNGSYCRFSEDSILTAIVEQEDIMETVAFKNYRGGNVCKIKFRNNKTGEIQVLQNSGGNDFNPVWLHRIVYFISDRSNIKRNIYEYNFKTHQVSQITFFKDFDIHSLSTDHEGLVFEKGGRIFSFDPLQKILREIIPQLPENYDFKYRKIYTSSGNDQVRSISISPNGDEFALDFRGDILKMNGQGNKFKNITHSTDVHEREPIWSNDGRLAFFSDEGGEYVLHIKEIDAKKSPKVVKLGKGFFYEPVWSPDGEKIAFCDDHRRLRIVNIRTSEIDDVASDSCSFINEYQIKYSWSPDSKLLTYHLRSKDLLNHILIFNTETKKNIEISKGFIDAKFPVFGSDGQTIYFAGCLDYGLSLGDSDMSSFEQDTYWNIYSINLADAVHKPLKIFSGAKNLKLMKKGQNGELFFIAVAQNKNVLMRLNPVQGNSSVLLENVDDFQINVAGNKILYRSADQYFCVDVNHFETPYALDLSGIQIKVDPVLEWRNIFNETLRMVRDFYKGYKKANVIELRKKYEPLLPLLTCKEDLKFVLREMLGELESSHVFFFSQDHNEQESGSLGLLGVDWERNQNRYRIKKIYHADSWGEEKQNPLDHFDIKEGQYLISVDGCLIDTSHTIDELFKTSAGKTISLGFNAQPDSKGMTEYPIQFLSDDSELRRFNWIEHNRYLVDSISNGRAGYIYLPNTHWTGYKSFKRYFFSQTDKDILIVDARFNGGGFFPDYMIDMLGKKSLMKFYRNDAMDLKEPFLGNHSSIALLVNSRTVSGGELLAFQFRQRKLGKIIGMKTVGLGNPYTSDHILLDGTTLVVPTLESTDLKGNRIIENTGLDPDIIIENEIDDPYYQKQLIQSVQQMIQNSIN